MRRLSTKSTLVFALAVLALCATLVLVLLPHASTSPDGLEKVAADKGFEGKAQEVWTSAPAKGYSIWAALAGIAAIFLLAWGLALVLRKRSDDVAQNEKPEVEIAG